MKYARWAIASRVTTGFAAGAALAALGIAEFRTGVLIGADLVGIFAGVFFAFAMGFLLAAIVTP